MAECSELAQLISEMALLEAAKPNVRNIDDIVASLSTTFPVRREDVVESLVLASKRRAPLSELAKKLKEIKQEARNDKNLQRQIEELEAHLEAGTLPEKRAKRKAPPDAIAKLRAIRNELKKKIAQTDIAKEAKALEREPKRIAELKRQIKELEKHIESETLPGKKPKSASFKTNLVKELEDRRSELKKTLNQSEPAVKERLLKQIEYLNDKIKQGIQLPQSKKEQMLSLELERLKLDRDILRKRINAEINALKPQGFFRKYVGETFNASRAMITAFDFSGVLRQGGLIALAHPVRAAKELPAMFRAFRNPRFAERSLQHIMKRENMPLYRRAKLFISDFDGSLTSKEEFFMSRLAEKIPGVAGSARAYSTFLNKLRADSFDSMVATLSKNGTPTQIEIEAIANFINVATGRASFGKFENASELMNTIFFAPKYTLSRFQYLIGQPLYKGTAATRKAIAKEYARYLAGLGTVYTLASLSDDVSIEWNPRSSDFGKIKIGNTRIDPLSGLSQSTVFLGKNITGESKSTRTGFTNPIRGEFVPYGGETNEKVISRFMRSKLSPLASTAFDVVAGENVIGEKVTPTSAVKNFFIPLSFREISEAMQEFGIPKGAALGLLSIFGAGLQTYK